MATMWIDERVEFLKKASRITEEQKLLIALYDEREFLTAIQKRKFDVLVTAERAAAKAARAKAELRAIEDNEKKQSRKERNHELFKAAGLLSLAGLLDKESGKPLDAGALLGALLDIAEQIKSPEKMKAYKQAGDVILNKINAENAAKAEAKAKTRAEREQRLNESTSTPRG